MKRKALFAYAGLLAIAFLTYLFPLRYLEFIPALYCLAVPLLLTGKMNFCLAPKDIGLGIIFSAVVIGPLLLAFPGVFSLRPLPVPVLVFQFFGVSLPEEVFFRGFLQDALRNDLRGVLMVSVLFSLAHLPALLFRGDIAAPLTFFPSLVMGFLYMRTSNVLPSAISHFAANVAFSGFVI